MEPTEIIAHELSVRKQQVSATISLLDAGATVPFIARYRKEATGSLDDTQLRYLEERLGYLRNMNNRCEAIIQSIRDQGKLTKDLESSLRNANSKTVLEDLYLPFKPKRRSKAQAAREAGLEPLADRLFSDRNCIPEECAQHYLSPGNGINDIDAALMGARDIIIEKFYENAKLHQQLRDLLWKEALFSAQVTKNNSADAHKFRDYFEYSEPIKKIPSHRALALFRGQSKKVLRLSIQFSGRKSLNDANCMQKIAAAYSIFPIEGWLMGCVEQAWKRKIFPRLEQDLKKRLKESAEKEAIQVFSGNLKDLLLAAPAGARRTMGLDPGIRTGVKIAIIDKTGTLLDTDTVYPHPPHKKWDESIHRLFQLIQQYSVDLISIGNGTGSRETDLLVEDLKKRYPEMLLAKAVTSEDGASVYSASQLAANEFPELDVSLRGAVSIARRLQDPLAELVKIEPSAIGVGQYQHDVDQSNLAKALKITVEDCVNSVGVDLNTASVPLLEQVSGISPTVAKNIVQYRNQKGRFDNRRELIKVPRLGEKVFEQAAGFLRITGGNNPLDCSAVHPEAYPLIELILQKNDKKIEQLIGNKAFLQSLNPNDYINDTFGLLTIKDLLNELEKPGRDPRPQFQTLKFNSSITQITDLKTGQKLTGSITNVTNFGAFVDIGVHQDGLVHISQLANTFVKDPRNIVKVGDQVEVRVLDVDFERQRISLSMKPQNPSQSNQKGKKDTDKFDSDHSKSVKSKSSSAMSEALLKALRT